MLLLIQIGDFALCLYDEEWVPCRVVVLERDEHNTSTLHGYFVRLCECDESEPRVFIERTHLQPIPLYTVGAQMLVMHIDAAEAEDHIEIHFSRLGPDVRPCRIVRADAARRIYTVRTGAHEFEVHDWQLLREQ